MKIYYSILALISATGIGFSIWGIVQEWGHIGGTIFFWVLLVVNGFFLIIELQEVLHAS